MPDVIISTIIKINVFCRNKVLSTKLKFIPNLTITVAWYLLFCRRQLNLFQYLYLRMSEINVFTIYTYVDKYTEID